MVFHQHIFFVLKPFSSLQLISLHIYHGTSNKVWEQSWKYFLPLQLFVTSHLSVKDRLATHFARSSVTKIGSHIENTFFILLLLYTKQSKLLITLKKKVLENTVGNCWCAAVSPFPTMFSKGFFLRVVKSRDCVI